MELQLRITRIVRETDDTKSFFLQPVDENIIINYKAGQFLTFLFNHRAREIRRSYSLGSAPGVDKRLFITVKRKVNGEISRYLLDHFEKGDIFTALSASGRFIIEEPTATEYFFIAAGSGITPVFALIKDLLYHYPATKIILINQNRNEDNIIYKKELYALHKRFEQRFQLIELFSRPKLHRHTSLHLNNTMLEEMIRQSTTNQKLQTINFYLCGPPLYMLMAEFTLKLMGFIAEQIRKEQFVIPAPPPAPLLTDLSPKNVIIHYQQKIYQLQVAYPQNILDAGLKKGIKLPYSCRAGRCSTCAAYCLSGNVIMSGNEVLTEIDLSKGLMLTCVGYAVTDVELNFDVKYEN